MSSTGDVVLPQRDTPTSFVPRTIPATPGNVVGFDAAGVLAGLMPPPPAGSPGSAGLTFDTIAELKAAIVAGLLDGAQAQVAGYYASGDGGGGQFYFDGASATADNGGTVIAPASGGGAWLRIYSGPINPKWFGAKGDDVNDTAAIQAAIVLAENGELAFSPGTYAIDTEVVGVSNIRITGSGATIKPIARIRSCFYFNNCANVTITGFSFDHNKSDLVAYALADYPTPYSVGAYFEGDCSDVLIANCRFFNLYTTALWFYAGHGKFTVRDCYFASPAQTQQYQLQFIYILSSGAHFLIDNNDFVVTAPASAATGTGAVLVGSLSGSLTVSNCRADHCGRDNTGTHRVGVFDLYGDCINVCVLNNVVTNCHAMFMRLGSTAHAEVAGNYVTTSSAFDAQLQLLSIESTDVAFATVPCCEAIHVHHNEFIETGGATTRLGVGITSYDWATYARDITVSHNKFTGMQRSVYVVGPYRRIHIEHNNITGSNGGSIQTVQLLVPTAAHGVTEAQGRFDDLFIRHNSFEVGSSSNFPIHFDYDFTPDFTGTIGLIEIADNSVRCVGAVSFAIFVTMGNSGTSHGYLWVHHNFFEGFTNGIQCRFVAVAVLEYNTTKSVATFFDNWGGNTVVNRGGNRLSTGACSGRATLAGGTVTVATPEVMAGDNILLTRVLTGGTQGTLSVGTIVAGTSFVIASSNAADTSTIYWKIDH